MVAVMFVAALKEFHLELKTFQSAFEHIACNLGLSNDGALVLEPWPTEVLMWEVACKFRRAAARAGSVASVVLSQSSDTSTIW